MAAPGPGPAAAPGRLRGPCTQALKPQAAPAAPSGTNAYLLVNRLTWGASTSAVEQFNRQTWPAYLAAQLHPAQHRLLPEVQAQIDAMTISKTPLAELVQQGFAGARPRDLGLL